MVDGPLDHYSRVVDIDLNGTFYCAKYAAVHWRRQKEEGTDINGNQLSNFTYGSFVATASMSGHIVNIPQMQAAYNAAKAAVIHLCKLQVESTFLSVANTIQANLLPWSGSSSPVPTLSLLATSLQRFQTLCPRRPRASGRTRSPWVVKDSLKS
jgi:hypothetical protein